MKSNKKKYFTTVGLIWAACSILLFFVYMIVLVPQGQTKAAIAATLAKERQNYKRAVYAAEKQTQDRLRGQLSDLESRLDDFTVDFGDSANLTFDISETASGQGISSFSVRSQVSRSAAATSTYTCISENHFDVSFSAGFGQFAAFLSALERHEPVLFVEKFAITRSRNMDLAHDAELNLAVIVRNPQNN